MVFSPSLYLYHDEVKRYDHGRIHRKIGPYTYERIIQFPNAQKNTIQYRIKYDMTKVVGYGLYFL